MQCLGATQDLFVSFGMWLPRTSLYPWNARTAFVFVSKQGWTVIIAQRKKQVSKKQNHISKKKKKKEKEKKKKFLKKKIQVAPSLFRHKELISSNNVLAVFYILFPFKEQDSCHSSKNNFIFLFQSHALLAHTPDFPTMKQRSHTTLSNRAAKWRIVLGTCSQ